MPVHRCRPTSPPDQGKGERSLAGNEVALAAARRQLLRDQHPTLCRYRRRPSQHRRHRHGNQRHLPLLFYLRMSGPDVDCYQRPPLAAAPCPRLAGFAFADTPVLGCCSMFPLGWGEGPFLDKAIRIPSFRHWGVWCSSAWATA